MSDLNAGLPPRYLRTPEAARFLSLSGRTLEKAPDLRHRSRLPKARRRVVYALEESEGLGRPRRQASTSEPGGRDRVARQAHAALCAPTPARRAADRYGKRSDNATRTPVQSASNSICFVHFRRYRSRDAQDLMAYPFFSLAKSRRIDSDRFSRGQDRHSCRGRSGTRHGDHLGCGRPDLGRPRRLSRPATPV